MSSDRGRSRGIRFGAALGLAAIAAGCTPGYVQNGTGPVMLVITSVNGGAVLNSDVRKAPSAVVADTVEIALANRTKNPNIVLTQIVPMAIVVERYEVSYYRSDGRGVQGIDVPYTISGNITATLDVAASGTVNLPIEVVRAQAKLEPPLINLWGPEPGILGGQALIVTMFARITVHGHTIAGQAVEASGTLQVTFSDLPDGEATT